MKLAINYWMKTLTTKSHQKLHNSAENRTNH